MNESFNSKTAEVIPSVEEVKRDFDVAMFDLREASTAVGQYETGLPETDLGLADILIEKQEIAKAAAEKLIAAIIVDGEKQGLTKRQGDLALE